MSCYERVLSIAINRVCLLVGVLAILPIAVGWLAFNFFLFRFFQSEGVMLDSVVWTTMSIGFACLMFILLILFTSIMESFDKELKKLYWDIKKHRRSKQETSLYGLF